jgi:hypothetical protein
MATLLEQLHAMRSLVEYWDGYDGAAPDGSVLDLAEEFVALLQALQKSSPQPPSLHVNPTRVGGVLIEWEDVSSQHEVEINPDQSISFLHFDKATGRIDSRKFGPAVRVAVAPGLLQELTQLIAA